MKRKTTEEFIEEAIKIHGNKYDYSKVDYVNTYTKVKIICPIHGVFEQLPREHLHKHGCPQCAKTERRDETSYFVEKARKIHGDKYDYSKVIYNGYHKKVCIICPEHGEFWKTPAKHLSSKQGCPMCSMLHNKTDNFKGSTTQKFIEDAKKVHGDKYDYSKVEYVNSTTKVCIICPQHGEFWQTPSNHLQGNGCRKCADEKFKIAQQDFISNAVKIWGDRYDYSKVKYVNTYTKVTIICKKHGEFKVTPFHFLNKNHPRGCPLCAIEERTMTSEEFINRAIQVHGSNYDYSKTSYVNSNKKVCVICPKHGEFYVLPSNHLKGAKCPHCASEMNVLETKLYDNLNRDFPQLGFTHSYKNKELLGKMELDMYSEKYHLAVEYQGKQHYSPLNVYGGESAFVKQKERDVKKKIICENENIKLLEFSYDKNEIQPNLITDYYVLKREIEKWLAKN